MVQGNLKTFQADYITIMKQEKTLLPEYLSSEQNTQSSSPDLKPTPAERPAQDPSSPPPQIYTCTAGALHKTGDGAAQRNRTQAGAPHRTPAKLRAHHTDCQPSHQERSQKGDSGCASEKLGVPHLLSD